MEFTVKERLVLGSVLPKEGKDYVTLTLASNLGEKVAFSSDEVESFGLTTATDGKSLTWKLDSPAKDIPIGPKTIQVVKDALLQMEKDNKLTADLLSLYKKFVGVTAIDGE